MTIQEIMTREVETVHAQDSGNAAAQKMWDADIGTVPVIDDKDRLVGMVTDRDLCMATYIQGRPLRNIVVAEVMAHKPASCRAGDSVTQVQELMRKRQVHRLPVVDAERHVIGLVSINDLVRAAQDRGAGQAQLVATLARITHPRRPRPVLRPAA